MSRTNQDVFARVSSFQGSELRILNKRGEGTLVLREWKHVVQDLLIEAGRDKPAIARFEVRNGVGYLIPEKNPEE